MKCSGCGVVYPSKYYFVDDTANGAICTECAPLTPEEREQRRTSSAAAIPADAGPGPGARGPGADRGQGASVHPLAAVSFCLGLLSVFLFPTKSIIAGALALGLGVAASRDIARSGGRSSGLWLARAGMVLGCGMAGAWTLTIVVGLLVR